MNDAGRMIGLIAAAAGGVETIRDGFVEPAKARGWQVAVTLTPTAGTWLEASGERVRLERATGLPVRVSARLPGDASPHPPASCYVVAPATANTVAKLALGIADNEALTTAVEAIGHHMAPVVVFPRINAAHARHPGWPGHMAALTSAGVHLVTGDHVWPLFEPREAPPDRILPWTAIPRRHRAADRQGLEPGQPVRVEAGPAMSAVAHASRPGRGRRHVRRCRGPLPRRTGRSRGARIGGAPART